MDKVNRYEFEGEVIEVSVCWDDGLQERRRLRDYLDGTGCTPSGRPILLTIEDACPHAEMVDDDPQALTAAPAAITPVSRLSAGGYAKMKNRRSEQETSACSRNKGGI